MGYGPSLDHRTPDQYARDFHEIAAMLRSVNPAFRVSAGAVTLSRAPQVAKDQIAGSGTEYIDGVLTSYEAQFGVRLPADAFAATAHVFEGGGVDQSVFDRQVIGFRQMLADHGYADRPFIVTEIGVGIGTRDPAKVPPFMEHVMDFAAGTTDPKIGYARDGGRLIQRMAWFTAHGLPAWERLRYLGFGAFVIHVGPTVLFTQDGQFTDLGVTYAARVALDGPEH